MIAPTIVHADALAWLREQPDNSYDACLCDPPYGLSPDGVARTWDDIAKMRNGKERRGFMGRQWDAGVPGVEFWTEVLRVLKPGAPILAFSSTRTYHRMVCAMEDAGFRIRDTIAYMFGSGFPKSLSIDKAIDSAAGAPREIVGKSARHNSYSTGSGATIGHAVGVPDVTAPSTELAKLWEGYGSALKPAYEPCVLAMKPLDGTYAENVATWGVGGLAIDACRVGYASEADKAAMSAGVEAIRNRGGVIAGSWKNSSDLSGANPASQIGRWPANVILDETAAAMLDEQSGDRPSALTGRADPNSRHNNTSSVTTPGLLGTRTMKPVSSVYADSGGASRFFYTTKSSRWEREFGCENLPRRSPGETVDRDEDSDGIDSPRAGAGRTGNGVANHHPTLKPIDLTTYLAKLICPPTGGRLLVPFGGSGSEAIGGMRAGFDVTVIEREAEYIPILEARIARWSEVPSDMTSEEAASSAERNVDPRQVRLFGT